MAFLRGGNGADSLVGTIGSDTLAGFYGSDRLNPGRGADRADGGPGADVLLWDEDRNSSGVIDNYTGSDWYEQYDANLYGSLSGGDRLVLGSSAGAGGFRVTFTTSEAGRASDAYGNRLNFTGIERIQTGVGNDLIDGTHARILGERHAGDANSYVPQHGLTVMAGAGNDTVRGTSASDVLDGGGGNDRLFGGGGTDLMMSSAGNDWVHGGAGDDNVRWGNNGGTGPIHNIGHDTLIGGNGTDLLNLWGKGDGENSVGTYVVLTGRSSGWATFTADNGRATFSEFEQFWTHEGRDTVSGANADIGLNTRGIMFNTRWGDDVLTGSRGNDTLEGGDGADTINGGRGNDVISMFESFWVADGGSVAADGARDVLVLQDGSGVDKVRAFKIGGSDGDRLNVGGMHDAQGNRVDVNDVRVGSSNGDAVLIFPNGERVIFEGVSPATLTRSVLVDLGIPATSSQSAAQNAPAAVQAARSTDADASAKQDLAAAGDDASAATGSHDPMPADDAGAMAANAPAAGDSLLSLYSGLADLFGDANAQSMAEADAMDFNWG